MDPITQQIIMGAAGAGGAEVQNYWFARIGGANDDEGRGTIFDSNGNVYMVGDIEEVGGSNNRDDCQIVKYDKDGAIQWQRRIKTGSFDNDVFYAVAVDSSDNVYAAGKVDNAGISVLAKYNTSGTIQWQRKLHDGANYSAFRAITIDSSDNIYVAGSGPVDTGVRDALLAKYNTSGTLQWQRALGKSSRYSHFLGVKTDSSGNIYVSGSDGDNDLIAKYNSSGTLQWHKTIADNAYTLSNTQDIALDSSGNIYGVGFTNIPNVANTMYCYKLNSSGDMQWSRLVNHVANRNEEAYSVVVNGDDDIFVIGESYMLSASHLAGIILKFNSSGTLQFTRTFMNSDSDEFTRFRRGHSDGNGNLLITGQTNTGAVGQTDMLVLKVPDDGSLTGTYSTLEYASASKTTTTENFTSSNGGSTGYTAALSSATSTFTEEASSHTNTTTSM